MTTPVSDGTGELIQLLWGGEPRTRTEVGTRTGWARVTVNTRIDHALDHGLVREVPAAEGARGRPAARFEVNPDAGHLIVADVGASAAHIARCDLAGTPIEIVEVPFDIANGPAAFTALLSESIDALSGDGLLGLGIALPGPVEFPAGRIVAPPIMTGWDGVSVPDLFTARYGVPVLVENDANAMAWGEHIADGTTRDLLLLKLGTGVGAGIVANGQIVHGAHGAAGDFGHTLATVDGDAPAPLCKCGKFGCVEAYAGGWAIIRDLRAAGVAVDTVHELAELLRSRDPQAISLVRQAGRTLGAGLAQAVSLLNPEQIVIVGQLAAAGEHLVAGLREHIARDSLPLATRGLVIRIGELGDQAGVRGLANALAAHVLSTPVLPATVERIRGTA